MKKTKDEIQAYLLKNPKYSSEWIDLASTLMTEHDYDEEILKLFNPDQLKVILSAIGKVEDINLLINPELNSTQMQILVSGYSNGLTTNQLLPYFDPKISYAKLNYALAALSEGFDMGKYVENNYDELQIYEIYSGYKSGIDYTKYDSVDNDPTMMGLARHALELGHEIEFNTIDGKNVLTIK